MKINAWMPQMFTIEEEHSLAGVIGNIKKLRKTIYMYDYIRDVAGNGVIPGYQT